MKMFTEAHYLNSKSRKHEEYSALMRLATNKVFEDTFLATWFNPITRMIFNHRNPGLAAIAIIDLKQMLNSVKIPSWQPNSVAVKQIFDLILKLERSHNPVEMTAALKNILNCVKPLSNSLKSKIFALFISHPHSISFADAIDCFAQKGLLSDEHAANNLNEIAKYTEIWFADFQIAIKIRKISAQIFSQEMFDRLVEMSANLAADHSNFLSLSSDISKFLNAAESQEINGTSFSAKAGI